MYCFNKELFLCIRYKMQQGVSPVNCLSFVAVGHLVSAFPLLDNYFLEGIDKKYLFFGGGVDFITSQVLVVI